MDYYILKVKGIAKIPDYLQIRDNNFALEHYLRTDRLLESLDKTEFKDKKEIIIKAMKEAPFGKVKKISL